MADQFPDYDVDEAEALVRTALVWMLSDEATDRWLDTPVPLFDCQTPRELLSLGPNGRDRVLAVIDAMASGAFL